MTNFAPELGGRLIVLRLLWAGVLLPLMSCTVSPAPVSVEAGYAAGIAGRGEDAYAIMARVAEERPGTEDAALAIDAMADLGGFRAVPPRRFECSREAEELAATAKAALEHRRPDDSYRAYDLALRLCPSNAGWLAGKGHAEYGRRNIDEAIRLYEAALAIDPWDRLAHSMLGTVLGAVGRTEDAWRHSILAVISDPGYQVGWWRLKKAVEAKGGRLLRRLERKPEVEWEDGEPKLLLYVEDDIEPSSSWTYYGMSLYALETQDADADPQASNDESGDTLPSYADWKAMSPWTRELTLVDLVLEAASLTDHETVETSLFWKGVRKASQRSLLQEAAFMGLLDNQSGPEYIAFRERNAERLIRVVTDVMIELPRSTARSDEAGRS